MRVRGARLGRLACALLLLLGVVDQARAAACVAIASGNWNAAGTWQSGTIPTTTADTASIGAFTITLTANASCGSITFTNAGTITGAFTLTTLGTITASGSDTISTTSVDIGNATETLSSGASAANVLTISAAIVNSSGTGNISVGGSGTVVLSGANTYNGTTTVTGGATLSAASAAALGATGSGTTVNSGGVLDVNGAALNAEPVTINGTGIGSGGALTGTGTGSLGGAVTLGSASSIGGTGTLTLSVAVAGGANTLSKVGSGTLIMGGNNTYTGATTLSAGTLLMNGTSTASAITLAGGTLGGGGTVGTVTSSATATAPVIQPGTSSTKGLLTTGAVNLSTGSYPTVSVRVTGTTTAGTDFDRLALGASTLTLGSESTLIVDVGGMTAAGSVDVITAGSVSGTFGTVRVINGAATVTYTATTVHVAATVDTLIAEYKCDSTSGTTLIDTSGNGLDGTFSASNFSWDPTGGWDAGALKCNGTGWVTLPLSPDLQPSTIGVSFWAKRTGGTWIGRNTNFLWTKSSNWYDSGYYVEMFDQPAGTNSLAIFVDGNGTNQGYAIRRQSETPDVLFPLNQWVHFFYTFNSATHAGAIYRNGGAVATFSYGSPLTISKTTDPRLLGLCRGELDLFRIYANPSAALIGNLANEVSAAYPNGKRKVWTGGGGNDNWSTGLNWAGGNAPSAGDNLVFDGATRLTPNNDYASGTAFRSISFTSSGFTLGGNQVTLTNGILYDFYSSGTNTVNLPITLAQSQSFTAGSGQALTIANTVATAGYTLTLDGEGTITCNTTGVIGGSGNVATGFGGGTCDLQAANTYSGTTTVSSGILRASNASACGTSTVVLAGGTLQVNANGFSSPITASGGTLDAYGVAPRTVSSAITTTSTLVVGANTVANAAGQTLTLSGVIGNGGSGGLTKVGGSTAILNAANNYTGVTTVSAGTLQCGAASRLPTSPVVATSVASGATLDCNSFNQAIGTLTGAGNVTLGSATLTVGGDSADGTFSGVISGTGGFTKSGSGTWTLSGANTFSGAATVSVGTVAIGNNAALGSSAGATTVASGATLRWGGPADIGAEPLTLSGTGVGGVGALYSAPGGAAVCSGAITLSGATRIGNDGGTMFIKGPIGSTGSLEKTGASAIILSGANGYNGATTVQAGTLALHGDTGTIASTSSVTVAAGAKLTIGGTGDVVWFEDQANLPTGAVLQSTGGDAWTWVTSSPAPYAGANASQSDIAGAGVGHQHYFDSATQTMPVAVGDVLFVYIYLDPANTPSEVMVQWNDGDVTASGWAHRAYWGANAPALALGTDGTVSRFPMGALPATGQWVRLEVPASVVGLEGVNVSGIAFTLCGGRATWDHPGHGPGASGSGAANPNRIGDGVAVTLTNGTLSLLAPANVARSETIGQLVIGAGTDTIVGTASGTGSATLTASGNVSRPAGGGTLSFSRGTAAPFAKLMCTGTANATVLPWTFVTQTSSAMGQYDTTNGLVQTSTGTIYTSNLALDATGNWTTTTTWNPNGTPGGSDDIVIATRNKVNADTAVLSVRNVTLNDTSKIAQQAITVNGIVRFVGTSSGLSWIGVNMAFGGNEIIVDSANAGASFYLTNGNQLSGTNGLTKIGLGTFDIQSNVNGHSGMTTVDQGTLQLSSGTAYGTAFSVASAGLLELNGVAIASEAATLSGTGANGDGTLRGASACSYGGPITLAADSAIGADSSAVFTISNAIGGAFALTLNDSGTLILSGAGTYSGATTLTGSGTVRLSADVIANANGPFGNAASAVTLSGSAVEVNSPTLSRPIAATSLGGRIDAYGTTRTVGSAISGSLTSGLTATYFAGTLRAFVEDDLRLDHPILGARVQQTVNSSQTFGAEVDRQIWRYGLDASATNTWINLTVQWDGWITVRNTTNILTRSDDDSRVWIDLNNNGVVDAGEWYSNGWLVNPNGQGTTTITLQSAVPPGTYRIRVQYEQEGGGAEMTLMWTDSLNSAGVWDAGNNGYIVPASCLTTNSAISLGGQPFPTIPGGVPGSGLIGCYFSQWMRRVTADDWRTIFAPGGTRLDATVPFTSATFGTNAERLAFGIGGADQAWTNFSVQWDGYITVPVNGEVIETASDDNSRLWIDLNGNGVVDSGEWTSNNWTVTGGQGATLGAATAALNAGTYAMRVQYEQGLGGYEMRLLWNDSGRSDGTWTGAGGTGYIIPTTYLSTGSVTATPTGQPLVMTGVISGALDLTKTGGSTATLAAANTYTGYTAVEGGTVVLTVANAIPSSSSVRLYSATTLNLNGFADTVGSIQGAGTLMLTNARLTCGGDNSSTTFAGPVSGQGGGITKQGSGTLVLSGTDSYSGTTIVNAGTLEVDGAIASSAVTVNAGTLQGTGTVGAIIADGGSVAPGTTSAATRGTLTGAAATIGAAAKVHVRIAAYATAGVDYDRLALGSGALAIEGATLEVDLSGLAGAGTASGVISCGSVTGTFAAVTILNNPGGYDARAVYTAGTGASGSGRVDVVVTSSLIAWYKLDESTGTFVSDSSGNGHHGTINTGGAWSPYGGKINGSLALASNASHAVLDSSTALQPSALTISCWIKRTAASWSARENVVFFAKFNDQWDANGWYLSVKGSSNDDIILAVDGGNFKAINGTAIDTFYPQNTWVHIAASFDSTSHTYQYYKDGANLGTPLSLSGTPLTISAQGSVKFIGQPSMAWGTSTLEGVDDIRIFSRVLSDTEVNQIFVAGRSTRTWSGLGGDANWNTAANWVGSVVPSNGDNLVFPAGASQTTNNNNISSGSFNSISFTGGGFTLNTNAQTLAAGIVNSVGSNTVATNLTLGANQTFSAATGTTLTVNGTIATGGNRLYIDGAGTSAYGGAISAGGGVTKTGTGTTTLSAANTYIGTTVIGEGEFDLATSGSLAAGSAVSITGGTLGGTGNVQGAITATGGTIRPGTSGARGILKAASTNLSGGGSVTIRLAGTLTTAGTDYDRLDLATNTGTLTLNGSSTLIVDLSSLVTAGRAANVITCSGFPVGTFGTVRTINNTNGWVVDVDYSASGGISLIVRARRYGAVGLGAPIRF